MFREDHLGEHVVFVHNYTDEERDVLLKRLGSGSAMESAAHLPTLFKCKHCASSFWTKRALSSHLQERHASDEPLTSTVASVGFVCANDGCENLFESCEEYLYHCAERHKAETKQNFKVFDLSFDTVDEFLEWKSDVEERTCTSFRMLPIKSEQAAEYACHRCSSCPENTSLSSAKRCTAFIKCRMRNDGTVEAIGCTDHMGHDRDVKSLLLTIGQKEKLLLLIA
ncbi:unnamed protein product, partial [Cylicostephanus goldi]